jgi:putative membrane protein
MFRSQWTPLIALAVALSATPAVVFGADKAKAEQVPRASLTKDDERYFERLAQANMAEVEAGKLGQSKAVSDEVKKYASQMVADHGKMLDQQKAMASAKNISMIASPAKSHFNDMKRLQEISGPAFDRAFMAHMVKDHEASLKLVRDIAEKAKDSDLRAAGQKAMPEIQKHLEMARKIGSATELPEKMM